MGTRYGAKQIRDGKKGRDGEEEKSEEVLRVESFAGRLCMTKGCVWWWFTTRLGAGKVYLNGGLGALPWDHGLWLRLWREFHLRHQGCSTAHRDVLS